MALLFRCINPIAVLKENCTAVRRARKKGKSGAVFLCSYAPRRDRALKVFSTREWACLKTQWISTADADGEIPGPCQVSKVLYLVLQLCATRAPKADLRTQLTTPACF